MFFLCFEEKYKIGNQKATFFILFDTLYSKFIYYSLDNILPRNSRNLNTQKDVARGAYISNN